MTPVETIRGVAAPLMIANIDTEILIRIDRLLDEKDTELGPYCFEVWRFRPDGSEDPEFILNQPPWRDANILLAGANFACGSSREHAVKALMDMGIQAVIAPSFGSIFYNNCFQNGLLPIQLDEKIVEQFAQEALHNPTAEFDISLRDRLVRLPDGMTSIAFEIDELRRQNLLQGLDDLSLIQEYIPEIDRFQEKDAKLRPWVYLQRENAV